MKNLSIDSEGASIVVTDDIEQRRCLLRTPEATAVSSVDGDEFHYPVDAAVRVESSSLTLSNWVLTFVRDGSGNLLKQIDSVDESSFDRGTYSIEFDESIKVYVRVEGELSVSASGMTTTIETDADQLLLGARSRHNRPAGTITTTEDPRDLMRAVSAFSSALKTPSTERSYPTLRGHPPEIELGEELDVPDGLEPTETGLRIEVPPDYRYIYPVASLSFYLGADLVPGERPRIVGEDGFEYDLVGAQGFERRVERVLKQTFLLDCVARTEGFYGLDLHERRQLDSRVDVDWAEIYGKTPTERLRAYLSLPWEAVADLVPEWKVTTHLSPGPANAELLPFFVNDLAVIRMPAGQSVTAQEAQMASLNEFARSGASVRGAAGDSPTADEFVRSATRSDSQGPSSPSLVRPESSDSIEQVWADEDAPVGATKASAQAFRNGLDHEPSAEVGVTVIVNDAEMAEEGDMAESVYGEDADYPFDLRVYEDLTTDRLKAVLETDRDFLHYVGHIDDTGFECTDGKLDARELDEVGVDAFFLNACSSYEQGMALLEAGAVGGVVTLSEVVNSGATRVGKSMIRLLNHGFPIRPALDVAQTQSFVGGQYITVGDGNVDLVQGQGIGAIVLEAEDLGDDVVFTPHVYATSDTGMGSFGTFVFAPEGRYYLTPGVIDQFRLPKEEAQDVLDTFEDPVWFNGELYWSGEIDLE